ncbi:hypothetical protein BO71DRAFT_400670 [Aspergillus ellipticus CBS 707.79]|uniref:Uncharacterized protein n=1 Tax=Aspergillus ellipticus CBS 707.79 TaxID=1448320 RepID=A0A319DVS3_9EURO|nr:hypothetical protein BO71DRAFT_400670 [Aspergillus ellipticus CBS 707.79]
MTVPKRLVAAGKAARQATRLPSDTPMHVLSFMSMLTRSKIPVQLKGWHDWPSWFEHVKTIAKAKNLWDYIDPDKTITPKQSLLFAPDTSQDQPATGLPALHSDMTMNEINRAVANPAIQAQMMNKGISLLDAAIIASVSKRRLYHHNLVAISGPRLKLKALRDQYQPTSDLWESVKWKDVKQVSVRDNKPRRRGIGAAGRRPRPDVYLLCDQFQADTGTGEHIWWEDLIEESDSGKGVSTGWKGVVERGTEPDELDPTKDWCLETLNPFDLPPDSFPKLSPARLVGPKHYRHCLCGVKHTHAKCPYLLKSKRPEGWSANPAITKRFELVRQASPAIRQTQDAAIEESGEENPFEPSPPVPSPRCICGAQHSFRECPYLIEVKRADGWVPDPVITETFHAVKKFSPYIEQKMEVAVQQSWEGGPRPNRQR